MERRRLHRSRALLGAALVAGLGSAGRADPAPPTPPAAPAQTANAAQPTPDLDPAAYAQLTDDQLVQMAQKQGEVVVVWDERPKKPFDRDTELRLTDRDLAARGVSDLGDALTLIPDVTVRAAGRGGENLDVRGERKAAVRILVDGIPLEDPYYGTFDLTSIPITDIVQIRVATSPASPIDGPGGPGGVIEVHTRDAIGDRLVIGRAAGDTLPTAGASATGRDQVGGAWGVRASATGTLGDHAYTVPGGQLRDDRRFEGGAVRVEWRPPHQEVRRAAFDVAGFDRGFVVPPADDETQTITVIDGDQGARATAGYDDQVGAVQIAARAFGYLDHTITRYFADASRTRQTSLEDLSANREGGSVLAHRALGHTMQAIASAHLDTEGATVGAMTGPDTTGRSTIGELAGGWQLENARWKLDAAAGVAVPIGVGAAPWPEGKLAAHLTAIRGVVFSATIAQKGRLPTLRERYRLDVGNAALDPEQTTFGELGVAMNPGDRVSIEASTWLRRQTGLIVIDPMTQRLYNKGRVDFAGFDARVQVTPVPQLQLGGAWSFIDAEDQTPDPPLDNLPANRLQGVVTVRPGHQVTATTRLSWIDSRVDKGTILPAHAEWEAEVAWAMSDRWLFSARGDDLADSRWLLHAGIPSAGRTVMFAVQAQLR